MSPYRIRLYPSFSWHNTYTLLAVYTLTIAVLFLFSFCPFLQRSQEVHARLHSLTLLGGVDRVE